jgi:hypothetical protein
MKEQPPWFEASQHAIINSQTLEFPSMDVLTRRYLEPFLREPDKRSHVERPCSHATCESIRLGGFRCRELLMPEQLAKVQATRQTRDLPVVQGWCFLCHLFETNRLYWESLNRIQSKTQKTNDQPTVQIHHFIVQVDVPGEYRLDKTLMGDRVCMGLFGPFPVYNSNWYKAVRLENGLQAWLESDSLVFRPAQTMLHPTASSGTIQQVKGTNSTPSKDASFITQSGTFQ